MCACRPLWLLVCIGVVVRTMHELVVSVRLRRLALLLL